MLGCGTGYALTELGDATRPIVEALGMWGGKAPKLGRLEHGRSARSVAVALQTFLARAGDALPPTRVVVELLLDEEPLEIVLGPEPTVTVRPSPNADAHVRTSSESMRDYLHGVSFNKRSFPLVSGEKAARATLLGAMAVFF